VQVATKDDTNFRDHMEDELVALVLGSAAAKQVADLIGRDPALDIPDR